mgnify:CR=1 FL=1
MKRIVLLSFIVVLAPSCNKGRDKTVYIDWNVSFIDSAWVAGHYSIREEMVPMRDGIFLSTAVWQPRAEAFESDGSDGFATAKEILGGRPVIIFRGDGASEPGDFDYKDISRYLRNFAARGYIFVFQSIRGTYRSEGPYVTIRPYNPLAHGKDADSSQTDESTDAYDTAEWIVHNTPNNGRLGIRGTSYTGYFATAAAIDPHPAMKTVSPQSPVTDWFMGDDYHHYGAFMLADATNIRKMVEVTGFKPQGGPQTSKGLNDEDLYNLFKGLPIAKWVEMKEIHGKGDEFLYGHKDWDDFWYYHNLLNFIDKNAPAALVVTGSYDSEDLYGGLETFRRFRDNGSIAHLVFPPWAHICWKSPEYERVGNSWFGLGTTTFFMDRIEYDFYRYYLEGKGRRPARVHSLPSSETRYEIMKGKHVDDEWIASETWPWKEPEMERLYLCSDGSVSFTAPAEGSRTYTSDPGDPVPCFVEPVKERIFDNLTDYMASDQSSLFGRKDALMVQVQGSMYPFLAMNPQKFLEDQYSAGAGDYVIQDVTVYSGSDASWLELPIIK